MATKKYVCKICGYVHEGNNAPDVCPLCKAGSDQFAPVAEPAAEGANTEAPKKKGINTNSDMYAIIYAAIVVVIVAFMLAGVSSALRPMQDENIRLDKMKQILASLHISDVKDAKAEYEKVVKQDAIINAQGVEVTANGGFDVVNDAVNENNLPIYICEVNGEEKYVIPMTGQGLWGGIWGYMAVNNDGNTIYGVYFSHSSETPGLGAEIAGEKFTKLFDGKSVMANGEVAIEAVKGRLSSEATQVNAISGATITCNGVNDMLKKCLGNYKTFLASKQQPQANVQQHSCSEATECTKGTECTNGSECSKGSECSNGAECSKGTECTKGAECTKGTKCMKSDKCNSSVDAKAVNNMEE